jgi:hypothetical protein
MGGDVGCLDRLSTPASGVALATVRGGIYAFGTGTDRQVWYRPVARNAPGWQSLGGVSLYGPAAVTSGTTAFVFVIGGDHQLYMRADSGYGWGPWTSLGGYLTGTPAVASLGEEHLRIFGRGADNELWTRKYNRGWTGWTYLGGILTSPPTATACPAYGQVEVSVRGANGLDRQLWVYDSRPGGVGGWVSWGGQLL